MNIETVIPHAAFIISILGTAISLIGAIIAITAQRRIYYRLIEQAKLNSDLSVAIKLISDTQKADDYAYRAYKIKLTEPAFREAMSHLSKVDRFLLNQTPKKVEMIERGKMIDKLLDCYKVG